MEPCSMKVGQVKYFYKNLDFSYKEYYITTNTITLVLY